MESTRLWGAGRRTGTMHKGTTLPCMVPLRHQGGGDLSHDILVLCLGMVVLHGMINNMSSRSPPPLTRESCRAQGLHLPSCAQGSKDTLCFLCLGLCGCPCRQTRQGRCEWSPEPHRGWGLDVHHPLRAHFYLVFDFHAACNATTESLHGKNWWGIASTRRGEMCMRACVYFVFMWWYT